MRAVRRRTSVLSAPHAWSAYLVAVASLTTVYIAAHFLGPHWLNSGPVFNLIGVSAVVALVLGARRNTPTGACPGTCSRSRRRCS